MVGAYPQCFGVIGLFIAKFKTRGIVRYFDRKSTKLLNNLQENKPSPKIIEQIEIFALFSAKTRVKSELVM